MPGLYRDCLLLECADADALTDALAGLSPRLVIWRVSETVVALDPEAADEVMSQLRRSGVTPRRISG